MDFTPVDGCSCFYCTAARKPEPEPCEACKAKDKTITELIAALSLERQPCWGYPNSWPVQHPYPPTLPSIWNPAPLPYVTC